jgi:ATP-dependent helicase/nuclease subunit A
VRWTWFGLLLRSSGDLDRYLSALRDAHIPYVVERDRSYYRRREIIDAAAMTRAIFDPLDHLALIGFLRSAVCGVPDAALLPLWAGGFPGKMAELTSEKSPILPEIIEMFTDVASSLAGQADRIPGIGRIEGWAASASLAVHDLALSRAELLRLPSDVFVERLRGRMMLEVMESARYQGVYRVANLDRFFRRLQEALEEGGDIEAVLRALRRSVSEVAEGEEGRPKSAIEDAVSIMTIHKAKGLDFDHVYLLQMHRNIDSSRLPYTAAERRSGQDWEYVLMGCPSLGWDQMTGYQMDVAAAERVRLLYVAMTRARDRLVLSGKWKTNSRSVDPSEAQSLLDLVGNREGGVPDLGMLAQATVEQDSDRVLDGSLSWVFPGRGGAAVVPPPPQPDVSKAPSIAAVQQVAEQLKDARADARRSQRRTRGAPVWATPEALPLEELPLGRSSDWARCPPRQAVGAAIHHALARWPLSMPDAEALEQSRALLVDVIRPLLRADQVISAVRAAESALSRVVSGGWIERIRALQDNIHGRHVPILVPPGDEDHEPVGFYGGFIDLLYTDPETGELVVVDIKTDLIRPEALPERVAAYQSQGRRLVGAVQDAMALDTVPCWELWFLELGTVHRAPVS